MRKRRLLWRLYPSYLVIMLLALVAISWDAWRALRETYLTQTHNDLQVRARLVRMLIATPLATKDYDTVDVLCKAEGRDVATRVTVILPSGTVVADSLEPPASMNNHLDRPEIAAALSTGVGSATRYSDTLHQEMMYVAVPVQAQEKTLAVVRTALPLTVIDQTLHLVAKKLIIGLLVIALGAALISLYVSRRISRLLEEMKRTAMRFAHGDLTQRLPAQDTDEFGELAQAMNHMAAQLDERIRATLRQHNEQEAMLSSMVEGMLAVDNEECLLKLNHAAAQMLGMEPDIAQGRSIQETVRNSDLQHFITQVLAGNAVREGEIVIRDHGECYLQLHGSPLLDESGHRIGALVVMNDVTSLRRLETVRRDFVANVSHELKTPITSIKGFVETLLDGSADDPRDARRFLEIIARHTDRLNAIIDDLLSLSRLEQQADNAAVPLADGLLYPVLSAAAQNCSLKAREKQIHLDIRCDGKLRAPINAPLLEQAVTNLIDNAVKYSEVERSVIVEAEAGEGETVIRVRDQGCGIAPEYLPRLFERFYRVDTGRSRKLGGTGLGLAIVKHIAQAHQGRVSVESTPGNGSIFAICLPDEIASSHE